MYTYKPNTNKNQPIFPSCSSIMCSSLLPPSLLPADCLLLLHHNNTSNKGCKWGELGLNWGPDVVGLSVGSQQQPFPLGELPRGGGGVGIGPVYGPPIINTAGEAHSPLLLLFTTVCFPPSPPRGRNAAAVTFCACGNGCVFSLSLSFSFSFSLSARPGTRTDSRDETNADNAARTEAEGAKKAKKKKAVKIDICGCFSCFPVWWVN